MVEHLREITPEVFFSSSDVPVFGPAEIAFLKERAAVNPRLRSRLCFHPDPRAAIHEMLIVHHRNVYVRPHRLHGKTKSQLVLEGSGRVVLFENDGTIQRAIPLGGAGFSYYRIPENVWHALSIDSEWLVFFEVIGGPQIPEQTEFAPWSPQEPDEAYMHRLRSA